MKNIMTMFICSLIFLSVGAQGLEELRYQSENEIVLDDFLGDFKKAAKKNSRPSWKEWEYTCTINGVEYKIEYTEYRWLYLFKTKERNTCQEGTPPPATRAHIRIGEKSGNNDSHTAIGVFGSWITGITITMGTTISMIIGNCAC